jgi:cell division septation protein DedD
VNLLIELGSEIWGATVAALFALLAFNVAFRDTAPRLAKFLAIVAATVVWTSAQFYKEFTGKGIDDVTRHYLVLGVCDVLKVCNLPEVPSASPPASTKTTAVAQPQQAQPTASVPCSDRFCSTTTAVAQPQQVQPTALVLCSDRFCSTTAKIPGTQRPGFMVHLVSKRNEADAREAFSMLKARYPRELGERNAIILPINFGSKGVVYRVLVGPFVSVHDAGAYCSNLKADGGQCLVMSYDS